MIQNAREPKSEIITYCHHHLWKALPGVIHCFSESSVFLCFSEEKNPHSEKINKSVKSFLLSAAEGAQTRTCPRTRVTTRFLVAVLAWGNKTHEAKRSYLNFPFLILARSDPSEFPLLQLLLQGLTPPWKIRAPGGTIPFSTGGGVARWVSDGPGMTCSGCPPKGT